MRRLNSFIFPQTETKADIFGLRESSMSIEYIPNFVFPNEARDGYQKQQEQEDPKTAGKTKIDKVSIELLAILRAELLSTILCEKKLFSKLNEPSNLLNC